MESLNIFGMIAFVFAILLWGRVQRLEQLLRENGNEVLLNTAATGIQRDVDGKISGVTAKTADGTELYWSTKTVVISTGGFTGNSELLHYFFKDY